jgi:hypothetical protein
MFVGLRLSTMPSLLIGASAPFSAVLVASCVMVAASPAWADDASNPAPPAAPQTVAASGTSVVPAPDVPAVAVKEQPLPSWLKSLSLGGGAILWYFSPVETSAKQNVDLFFANLLLDGHFGSVGLHIEPRFRDSRLRAFYPGPVWAQEAYVSVALAKNTLIKAGKEYSHFGLFWDNSFYGNVQVYDGLKLDPDYGLSLEGAVGAEGDKGLRYYAQYFVIDGHTNVSLDGRDTISIPGANRRNQSILRAEPFIKSSNGLVMTGGLSGAFLQAALPIGTKNVYRGAADLKVAGTSWTFWGEYTYQNGQTVTDFPVAGTPATGASPAIPGQASAHNHYGLVGGQYTVQKVTLRYNVSTGRYSDVSTSEWMHVPALAVAIGDNLTVLGEYVDWRRYTPAGHSIVDRSVDVTLNGHF